MNCFGLVFILTTWWAHTVWANGPLECPSERAKFCPGFKAQGDVAVYNCLEGHLEELGPACLKAILDANPVLREEREVQQLCQKESQAYCAQEVSRSASIICLEKNYKQLGGNCLAKIIATNPVLREQIKRDAEEEQRKVAAALAEIEKKKKEEEQKLEEDKLKLKQKLLQERYQQRYKVCQNHLKKTYPSSAYSTHYYYCERYAQIPIPSSQQESCMNGLIQGLRSQYKSKFEEKMQNELDAWHFCKERHTDSTFITCTKKRLVEGDDLLMAGNSCDPLQQRCLAHLTDGKKTLDSTHRAFLYAICSSFQSYYMTENECADKEAAYWMDFYHQPKDGYLVQQHLEKNRAECRTFFEKIDGFMDCIKESNNQDHRLRKAKYTRILVHLCKESPVYRKCVLKKFFRLPTYIQELGYPSNQREQEEIHRICTLDQTLKSSSPQVSVLQPTCR
ncbi:MAG: hypothetical protein HYV97_18370 [Bdellovibrio sp.]|nr:hypothetical protein [Bdellovibrio sp.]